MSSIAHIVPHMGGGLGAVIKNLILNDTDNTHTILSLNPDDPRAVRTGNIYLDLKNNYDFLEAMVYLNDIVVMHWFNNVLLYDLLIRNGLPECRLLVWSHASNLFPPYVIPEKLINLCDKFIMTSPVTIQAPEFDELMPEQKDKTDLIWSVADMSEFMNIKKIPHDTFNIGYAGTIDFNSKLHPDFVELCKSVNIPNVKFIVCSSGPDLEKLKQQVADSGMTDKFFFTGRVADLSYWFAQMDVFGYPLYEKHYGTCEQVLGEAMCSGVVPVVLDNPPERCIIKDNVNGRIVSKENYHKAIEDLHDYKARYDVLSTDARKSAMELYNTKRMVKKWQIKFDQAILHTEKRKRRWPFTGAEIFQESLGRHGRAFDKNIMDIVELYRTNRQWKSVSKGSIYHYAEHYPEDNKLQFWKKIADEMK